jgi:[histone H3]-lysine36 N-trimethyltransferase
MPEPTRSIDSFVYIDSNEYLCDVPRKCIDEDSICVCGRTTDACSDSSSCLNRLSSIECLDDCPAGSHCQNKRFQRKEYSKVIVAETPGKGCGLIAEEDIPIGRLIIEYVGEIVDYKEFLSRLKRYSIEERNHYYFMALESNLIIDSTIKGNIARFMNHSCNPNCKTHKWVVNGQTRVGIFSLKSVQRGTELVFDYRFEGIGPGKQQCLCKSSNCRGIIGSLRE